MSSSAGSKVGRERRGGYRIDDLAAARNRFTTPAWSARSANRALPAQGFDPVYGARPLRRFIAREVETRIGRALLGGDLPDGTVIEVDVRDDEIVVGHREPATPGPAT